MKNLIKVCLLIIILIPFKVRGACTVDDKMRYNSLSSNITTSYEYKEENGNVLFNVTIHNVHRDLVVIDTTTNKRYQSSNNSLNNFTITNLKDGSNYSFNVYAKSGDCSYRLFNTLYVTTPKYNKYYSDPVCIGASDYSLCQKWAEIGNISYEEFKNKVEEYKNPDKEVIIEEPDTENNWLYIIGDFWAKYYLYILGGIIIVLIPVMIIIKRREHYDF